MTGGARIPEARVPVFPARPFLQKEFSQAVENEHVHGPVAQVIPMHFAPRRIANDLIVLVHHWEALLGLRHFSRGAFGAGKIRKRDPLFERKLFRTGPRIEAHLARRFLPTRHLFFQQIPQLLAALGKSAPDHSEKSFRIVIGEFVWKARSDPNESGIDIGPWKKNARRHGAQIFDAVVQLHDETERAVITRPG